MKKEETVKRVDDAISAGAAKSEIERLASLSPIEYDRQRKEEAKKLDIKLDTLDREVAKLRAKQEAADDTLPHWNVDPCPDPVDGAALLDAIRKVFRRYIVLPQSADIALALWVLHAWTMDAGEISPFMVLVSPTKRCGKTSVLVLLQYLTPRSELASNITPSALFRYIEEVRPTLLIDEADSFIKDNEELRGILNSGHTKTAAYVIRTVEVAGDHKPRRFSTWAPKAIATIRKLADTLEDRAIIVLLQRKPPGAQVERLRRRDNDEFAKLRSQAARWAADNSGHLVDPDPQMPAELNDRAADNWRPLLAIADLAGGSWPALARPAALKLSGESQDSALGVELLRDIREAFGGDTVIRSVDLVTKLSADPERPWAEYNHGKPITQRQVARLLDAFHIISCTVHPLSLPHGKGYRRVDFEEAWEAYCPGQNVPAADPDISKRADVQVPVKSAQVCDFRSVRKGEAHGSKNTNLSNSHAGLHVSTDKKSQGGGEESFDQPGSPFEARPATNGGGALADDGGNADRAPGAMPGAGRKIARQGEVVPGPFLDADGKPIDDPEQGYYGRKEREQGEEAFKANLPEPQRWDISNTEAARYANRYRGVRKDRGELAANRVLRWELERHVSPNKLQRELERIRQLALTEATAAIQSSNGAISAITTYRRHNNPALGPVGDTLDDLQ
jgi:hypothetical protein